MDRKPREKLTTNDQAQSSEWYTTPRRLFVFKGQINLNPNGPGRHTIDEDEWEVCYNRAAIALAF